MSNNIKKLTIKIPAGVDRAIDMIDWCDQAKVPLLWLQSYPGDRPIKVIGRRKARSRMKELQRNNISLDSGHWYFIVRMGDSVLFKLTWG